MGIHVVGKFEMSLERMKFEIIYVRAKVGKFSTKLEKSWKATIKNTKVAAAGINKSKNNVEADGWCQEVLLWLDLDAAL